MEEAYYNLDTAEDTHYITVVTTFRPCGKHAKLMGDKVTFESKGDEIVGDAVTVHVPTPQALANVIAGLTSHQYIITDFVQHNLQFKLITQDAYSAQFGNKTGEPVEHNGVMYVAQTMQPGLWKVGAWRVLDRDIKTATPQEYRGDYEQWLAQVEKLLPGVSKAPRVVVPSSKARVRYANGEKAVEDSLNCHTWVMCSRIPPLEVCRARIKYASITGGLTWQDNTSKCPTLFDYSIWTSHRNIYSGAPTVAEGLKVVAPEIKVFDGEPLDLAKLLLPLTAAEAKELRDKHKLQAQVTEKGGLTVVNDTELTLDTEIEIKGHGKVTVREFWGSKKFEFDEKYRCQATFRESSSWNGILRKMLSPQRVMLHDNGDETTYRLELPWFEEVKKPARTESNVVEYNLDEPLTAEDFVVHGFIRTGITVIAGGHGAGKSTALVPLCMHVAGLGQSPLQPELMRRKVVYFTEDARQIVRMLHELKGDVSNEEFRQWFILRNTTRLSSVELAMTVQDVIEKYQYFDEFGVVPPLLVFDTSNASFDLENDNDNSEVGKMVSAIKENCADAAVWIVGHLPKAINRDELSSLTFRGAGAWEADAHTTAFLFRDSELGISVLATKKRRFEASFDELHFKHHVVERTVTNRRREIETTKVGYCTFGIGSKEARINAAEAIEEAEFQDDLKKVCDYITNTAGCVTKTMVREACFPNMNARRWKQMLEDLLGSGAIEEVPLAKNDRVKNARTQLVVVEKPAPF